MNTNPLRRGIDYRREGELFYAALPQHQPLFDEVNDAIKRAQLGRCENLPPTTELNCAGQCLTQEAIDLLSVMLREMARAHPVVDIRIRNVSLTEIPKLSVIANGGD